MHLDKFVHSQTGKVIMSIILGIGLATFFRSVCKGRNCRIMSAPPMKDIEGQTYKFDNKCYTFEPKAVSCKPKNKTVIFA